MADPTVITLAAGSTAYESEVMPPSRVAGGPRRCVIVNTCAVTGEAAPRDADRFASSAARSFSTHHRHRLCCADRARALFAALEEVDHVIGNAEKMKAADLHRPIDSRIGARAGRRHHERARDGRTPHRRVRVAHARIRASAEWL